VKDPIALVEAAYEPAADETTWLNKVLLAANPILDTGCGTMSFIYDATDLNWATLRATAALGLNPALGAALLSATWSSPGAEDTRWLISLLRTSHVTTGQATFAGAPETVREFFGGSLASAGFADVNFINATDPTRVGVALVAPSATLCRLTPTQRNRWSRLAAHVTAGLRIRRVTAHLAGAAARTEKAEAVIRPDGRVEHAEGPAQGEGALEALSNGARALDRARGSLRRRDADEALRIWEGLLAGRWSLVDHVDSDGRRYLLAHRNDPKAPDVRGLTLRERQVLAYVAAGHSNKMIAYELGLSMSTVSGHLARARQKLGLPSLAAIRDLLFAIPPSSDG
jgi:DNA-binding CsgD family transcriptional regulator